MNARGGRRQGAGRKGMWRNGETQTIRVPVVIKEELMDIGQQLDRGQGIIAGQTCLQLQQLLAEWEAKCQGNEGTQWEQVRQLLTQIQAVLAQRQMRGMGRCRGNRGMGNGRNDVQSEFFANS